METQLSILSFVIMILLTVGSAYMFYLLTRLSLKVYDLNYYVNRPQIPFETSNNDPYKIPALTKSLI